MLLNRPYLPEGMNKAYSKNTEALKPPFDPNRTGGGAYPVEWIAERCDSAHNLHGKINGIPALIRREDAIHPAVSGAEKEISVIALVGRSVACHVLRQSTENGSAVFQCSRAALQEEALDFLLSSLQTGDIIPAVVTSMSAVGAFVDIGCGIIALIPIRQISVSRINHPNERFTSHQRILAVVDKIDREEKRFLLSHKELLGTWAENAALFQEGETVTGVVRGIKSYGIFIELTPNLTGLAEADDTLQEGDRVSVLIKSILPEKHKIKLYVVGKLPPSRRKEPLQYFQKQGRMENWVYIEE